MKTAGAAGCAVLVVLVALVSACGGGAQDVDDAPDRPGLDGVTVEVLQYRRDEADRVVEVKVVNDGDAAVRVSRLELVAPGFDGVGPVAADPTVAPGQAVDVRLPYGEPDCSQTTGPARVRLWHSGSRDPVELAPTAGDDVLRRIHDRECSTQRALAAGPVTWAPQWVVSGADKTLVVDGTLVVGPVADGVTVRVVALEGTTLFGVSTPVLPVDVRSGETASVPVRFEPQRCDPHAVGESKRGYAFGVRLAVLPSGESPSPENAVLVTVSPDERGRATLEGALLERCGLD